MNIPQLARTKGCDPSTVYRAVRSGALRATRDGNEYQIDPADATAWQPKRRRERDDREKVDTPRTRNRRIQSNARKVVALLTKLIEDVGISSRDWFGDPQQRKDYDDPFAHAADRMRDHAESAGRKATQHLKAIAKPPRVKRERVSHSTLAPKLADMFGPNDTFDPRDVAILVGDPSL